MKRAGPPLSELREKLRDAREPEALRHLLTTLAADSRAGARSLAEVCERRLARLQAERVRLRGLFALRAELRTQGVRWVAGVDEVGVGPLAGPVVAAAVILKDDVWLPGLDDSKKLSARRRSELDALIRRQSVAVGIGEVSAPDIDRVNILRASLEAMRRAVAALSVAPDHLLVDARTVPGWASPQTAITGGDGKDGSIAAASIVAKVHRDALMDDLDARHPGYGFARHNGYPTAEHLAALQRLGASPEHRRSFGPVANAVR